MARKLQIRSLSDLAVAELANMIVSTVGFAMQAELDNDVAFTMVEVNTYLDTLGATGIIYQDMLRVILCSDYLEASIRFTCLQMLLNQSVQSLVTEIFPFPYYEKILQVIAAQGQGLRLLNLKGVWIKDEHMVYMHEIIKKLPKLVKLSIPYIANDELLSTIADYSENLKVLDVSGNTDITEIGIVFLCSSFVKNNLTIVDIGILGEENICHTDIAMLIQNMPNLVNLVTYSFVGKSLRFICDKDPSFRSKLKYIHDTKTQACELEAIVKLCPHLESLYMDNPQPGIINQLEILKLNRLKINKFNSDELLHSLKLIGKNLSHLTMVRGIGALDLSKVQRFCPNLINLDCYMMNLESILSDMAFEQLQGLEMLNSPLSTTSLKHFISKLTNLRRLAIDTVSFTDEDMMHIFLENDFKLLEDIWFTSAPNLTVVTVEVMMDRCSELQSLGQLSGWDMTTDDLSLLRGILRSNNSSLVLSPTSIFP